MLLLIFTSVAILLFLAYQLYGRWLGRRLELDDRYPTPAVVERDGIDFEPISKHYLLGQHFSAIAAAGPIVGPILAGTMFGWLPALLWIAVGAILIGGVHDLTALVASVRHQARSVTEVVRAHLSHRVYLGFLAFIWCALVLIIVAFTDITASQFGQKMTLDNGVTVPAGTIATASLLYLALPVLMGLALRFLRWPLWLATVIFVPLVIAAVAIGRFIPLDLASLLHLDAAQTTRTWSLLILAYCLVAGLLPVWLLLQPRGHLGGIFLYAALGVGFLGLCSLAPIQYPMWKEAPTQPMIPMLFILVACGACSGFHALVGSGTTCKQLARESDARQVGYGAMLLEALVAVGALGTLMVLAPQTISGSKLNPSQIYAVGLATMLERFHIPVEAGITFALMAFATFVYDTLDICTRLGRYVLEELTGIRAWWGRIVATALTAGVPAWLLLKTYPDAKGQAQSAYKAIWPLFGAANQLLAALVLLGITVWLARSGRARWALLVTGLPTLVMLTMSVWALLWTLHQQWNSGLAWTSQSVLVWAALILLILTTWMIVEAALALTRASPGTHQNAIHR